MSRIRTIKPDFWTDEKVMDLPAMARLLFIGLWNFADDYGRMPYAPRTIKAQIFPEDQITGDDVAGMIKRLSANGQVILYSAEGKEFLAVTNWDKHQKIDNKSKPKFPSPFAEDSIVLDSPRESSIGKAEEGKGKGREEEKESAAVPARLDPEKIFFDQAQSVLGSRSLAAKLLKSKSGNVAHAHAALLTASQKSDPREYIGAIIRRGGDPPTDGRSF